MEAGLCKYAAPRTTSSAIEDIKLPESHHNAAHNDQRSIT
jgi:hypothetical protein